MTIKEIMDERGRTEEGKRKAQIEIGKKITAMINAGYSNNKIAKELGMSESSVRSIRKTHFE